MNKIQKKNFREAGFNTALGVGAGMLVWKVAKCIINGYIKTFWRGLAERGDLEAIEFCLKNNIYFKNKNLYEEPEDIKEKED